MKSSIRKTSRRQALIRLSVLATLIFIAVGGVTRTVRADVSCAPVQGAIHHP